MIRNIEVVGLGALNIDHLYRVGCILEDGESTIPPPAAPSAGQGQERDYPRLKS
jgi:hypothetical protein